MSLQKGPAIFTERIHYDRVEDFCEAVIESGRELFGAGFVPKPEPTSEGVRSWIKEFDELWENNKEYHFQIIDKATDQLVGTIFFNHIIHGHKLANMGYWVRTSRVGEGIATEAARQVSRYGFEQLGFQRIEIVVIKDNLPSLRIAEKIGAVREGLLRNRLQLHGSANDAYMHSLIPQDFGFHKSA